MSPSVQGVDYAEGTRYLIILDLQPEVDKVNVIKEINKIAKIKGLRNLEVGTFKDLGDVSVMSDYEIAISHAL